MSQIKLKHSGGNGVIIAAPSSNPAADRTLLLPSDGDSTIDTLGRTGNALQTISTVKKDIFTTTATSTANGGSDGLGAYASAVLVTGLTATITPLNSNNLLIIDIFVGAQGNTSDTVNFWYVVKDGNANTNFIGNQAGTNSNRVSASTRESDNARMHPLNIRVMETAGSTSARTYGLKCLDVTGGSGTLVFGATGSHMTGSNATNGLYFIGSCPSTITVTEVSA